LGKKELHAKGKRIGWEVNMDNAFSGVLGKMMYHHEEQINCDGVRVPDSGHE